MNTIVCKDYQELSVRTARLIADAVAARPDALLCFPAGETSLGTFAELIKLQESGQIDFTRCKIVGLDEWVHLGARKDENCYSFLRSHLFDQIRVRPENLCFFNGEADDLDHECAMTDNFIKANHGVDLMLLGVGMNGHLGLNEPGTPLDVYSHTVELDETTKKVGQKYFSTPVRLSQGITLGLRQIMESKQVIVQISGRKKTPVVRRLLHTEVTSDFPVSVITQHSNALLLIDEEASQ